MSPTNTARRDPADRVRHRATLALIAWIRFVRRHHIAVLAVALVSTVLAGWYTVENVAINTSTTDMLSEDLPFQKQFVALDKAFPQDYRTIVVVIDGTTPELARAAATKLAERLRGQKPILSVYYPQSDPFFRRNGLLFLDMHELQAVADQLVGAQPLLASLAQDPSLRGLADVLTLALDNVGTATAGGQKTLPPQFEQALAAIADTAHEVEAGKPATFSWRSAFGGLSGRLADTRQILLLEPSLDYASLEPAAAAIAAIRTTAAGLEMSGVRVRLTGEPVMMEDELHTVEQGIGVANLLSFAVVLTLLIIALRSSRLVEGTTFSLLVGLTMTAFFAVFVIGEFNLISVAFAVLFIGFGVDFGIHLSLRYKEYVDAEIGPGMALDEASVGVAPGLALTTIAAAIGFLSFVPTAYKGLVELGVISSAGMVIALTTTLSVLPAYLALRPGSRSPNARQQAAGRSFDGLVQRRARTILLGAVVLLAGSAVAIPFARFDDSPLNLRDPRTESVSTLDELINAGLFDPYRASVLADNAAEAERIAAQLRKLPEVSRVDTLDSVVPPQQDEKLAVIGDLALLYTALLAPAEPHAPPSAADLRQSLDKLRTAAATAAERVNSPSARRLADTLATFPSDDAAVVALQKALLSGMPSLLSDLAESLNAAPVTVADVPPMLLARKQSASGQVLVEAYAKTDLRDERERRKFASAVQSVVPAATGEAIAVTEAGRAVIQSFFQAGGYSFLAISFLLIVVLRTARDTLMVLAPLVLAGALTVATTVLIDVPFNFANVIVLPLLFGLGVSSGINMVVRSRQQGARSLLITSTPRAVLFSALTTIGSFGSLALSPHPGMASMGLLLMIALTYTTLCTLLVLPALRHVLGARHAEPEGTIA